MHSSLRAIILAACLLAGHACLATEAENAVPAAAIPTATVATAQARLTFDLISRISKDSRDAIVSPASLATLLALLGKESDDPAWKKAVAKIIQPGGKADDFAEILAARERLRTNYEAAQSADALIFPPGASVAPKTSESLRKQGVESEVKDLSKPADVAWLNDKVKALTRGAIPVLIEQPLDAPGFVAINALHFRSKWRQSFDPQLTVPAPFAQADGAKGEVKLMRSPLADYSFHLEGRFVAVELPFDDNRSTLTLITTHDKPAKLEEFKDVVPWLGGDGFAIRKGDVALPRFALSGANELLPALDDLGLAEARKSPAALGTFVPGAILSRVIQRAVIEADEQGAEAAAATAVITTRSLGDDGSLHMVVDKPFLFALRDKDSGLILVSGYISHAPKGKGD